MPGLSIARDHGGSSLGVGGAMASLARSIPPRFSAWGPGGDVVGTFADNVPTTNVSCFVSVADAVGTLGTLVPVSGHLLLLFSLSSSISFIHTRFSCARGFWSMSPMFPTSPPSLQSIDSMGPNWWGHWSPNEIGRAHV